MMIVVCEGGSFQGVLYVGVAVCGGRLCVGMAMSEV